MEPQLFQSASSVLMVRPVSFGYDAQTAKSNAFQHEPQLLPDEIRQWANDEFETAVAILRTHGVTVRIHDDNYDNDPKPNAVFPNNWLTTWPDGSVYVYPMATESRRVEKDQRVIDEIGETHKVKHQSDLSPYEDDAVYLEGTGVMVFDHINRIVYGCMSVRCDETLFRSHAQELGYQPIVFHGYDAAGIAIYHTNVMMGIQTSSAVVCLESIRNVAERELVVRTLIETGHEIIDITLEQMEHFCGNVLELRGTGKSQILALSQTAYDHFTSDQREALERDKLLVPLAVPTIESVGGGSIRCMLAEVFLPKK